MTELPPYQRFLSFAALSMLRSEEDLRTAVEHTRISTDTLVEAVVAAAPMLLGADDVVFSEGISPRAALSAFAKELSRTARARWRRAVASAVAAGLAGVASVVVFGWPALAIVACVLACVLAFGLLGPSAVRAVYGTGHDWTLDPDWGDVFRQRVLAPFLREQINRVVNTREHERFFHGANVPRLSDLSDREQIAATSSAQRLATVTSAMTSGSIAISGPRGVGKTTLLRGFCDSGFAAPDAPELRLMVSAPVVYDVRDFVVHLYKQLCLAVIRAGAIPDRPAVPTSRRRRLYAAYAAISVLAGLAMLTTVAIQHSSSAQVAQGTCLLLGGALASLGAMSAVRPLLVRGITPLGGRRRRALVTVLSSAVAAAGVALIAWTLAARPRRIAVPSTPWLTALGASALIASGVVAAVLRARSNAEAASIEDEARQNLRQLRFLQTFSTGHSGTLTVPGGVQLGRTAGKQLAEQRLSLPEIVDQYREFAAKAGAWWRKSHGGKGRLVIGIDEIDKIRDAVSAEGFVNDLKAIFGTPNCLYLVSVSDEALIGFQQRSPALRAAFDSAFDEMLRVEHLSLADVRELLRRRVAGISDPFIALCYVLSGGLPRDVLRTVRALVEARSGARGEIADLADALIARELTLIKQTLLHGMTGDGKAPDGLLKDLLDATWPEDMLKAAAECARTDADPTTRWLSATLYFLATVSEAFGPGLDRTIQDLTRTDLLAHARATLAIDAGIAAELVSRFRGERGLARLS